LKNASAGSSAAAEPGASTCTTSAPWSASMTAVSGPAIWWPKSMTRTPWSGLGSAMSCLLRVDDGGRGGVERRGADLFERAGRGDPGGGHQRDVDEEDHAHDGPHRGEPSRVEDADRDPCGDRAANVAAAVADRHAGVADLRREVLGGEHVDDGAAHSRLEGHQAEPDEDERVAGVQAECEQPGAG